MKRFRIIAVLAMAICLVIGTMSAFAYDYKLTVSGGNSDPEVSLEGKAATITIGEETIVTVTKADGTKTDAKIIPPTDNHVAVGFKLAGHDNGEILPDTIVAGPDGDYIALRNQDLDLVVAYALKSDLVKYEIRYQDQGGNTLLPAETHYGAAGSRQVVSFKHVAGYLPNTYNYIGTLNKGETTVFTFSYSPAAAAGEDTVITIDGGGAAGGGAAGGAGGAGAGGAGGANINDGDVPAGQPADVIDIDDDGTPTTDPDGTDIDDNDTPGVNWGIIGGGAALVAAIAAAAIALARRRRDEEDEDEE